MLFALMVKCTTDVCLYIHVHAFLAFHTERCSDIEGSDSTSVKSHLIFFFFPCNFSHHLVSVVHRHLYRLHFICGVRNTMGACCMLCNLACHGGKIDSSTQSRAFVHLSTWEAETGRALKASERLCPFSVFRKTTLLNV